MSRTARVDRVRGLHNDVVVERERSGAVRVQLSTWLRPVQRLVVLRMIADLLDVEPRQALVMHMHIGQVLAQTRSLATGRLVELMDRPELTSEEYVEAVELVCVA